MKSQQMATHLEEIPEKGAYSGQGHVELNKRIVAMNVDEEEKKPEDLSYPGSAHSSPKAKACDNPVRPSMKHKGISDIENFTSPSQQTIKVKQMSSASKDSEEEKRIRLESIKLLNNNVSAVSCAHCQNVMTPQDFMKHQDDCLLANPDSQNMNLNRHNSSGSPFAGKGSRN